MPWGLWSYPPPPPSTATKKDDNSSSTTSAPPLPAALPPVAASLSDAFKKKEDNVSWDSTLDGIVDWHRYTEPRNIVPSIVVAAVSIGLWGFWRSYLRRLPGTAHIAPGSFRRRSLLGKVTSVGDGDNFHLFHTPGGRLAGWGWLRSVPVERKMLKGRTIPVRIAGVDAPEGAHFGKPAQPHAAEALEFLRSYLLGRRVRAYIYRRDQYERVVATVFVRKAPFFLKKDVGLEMIKQGLATTYEAKTGAEFGGPKMQKVYEAAEALARRKGKGMWAKKTMTGFFGMGKRQQQQQQQQPAFESPRAFKDRMKAQNGVKVVGVEGSTSSVKGGKKV
ncbi:hypothetical protein B0T17DRAFT_583794 [Bombardia bombarda]|uniref:Probable endonuclease LCL3 n=1 Tax=Bombardia bombarda TaxID=252184 RepID=A0AA39WB09_9PEZI|nr:hypothetical protein B0T17DRAFT_583794 [Bombardia bombarda]